MLGPMSTSRPWMLGGAFYLGLILAMVSLFSSRTVYSPRFTAAPVSAKELEPGAWFEIKLTAQSEVNSLPLGFILLSGQAGGWEQRFERVIDALEIRVGSAKGQLITFQNKGQNGRFTWHRDDGSGTMNIQQFVGNSNQIRLWARVWSQSNQRPNCVMDTLYNGQRRQHWEFDGEVEYGIGY